MTPKSFQQSYKTLLTSLLIATCGCSASFSVGSSDSGDSSSSEAAVESVAVRGTVIDQAGKPLADVVISAGKSSTKTDTSGSFALDVPATQAVIEASRQGYASAFQSLEAPGASEATLGFVMFRATRTRVELGRDELTVAIGGNAGGPVGSLTIPPASIVDEETGKPVEGPVDVAFVHVTPEQIEAGLSPLPMQVGDSPMISYGMSDVTITSADGRPCTVAAGKPLTLVTAARPDDPPEVPWWSFDEDAGIWRREGTARPTDAGWVAELPHLSWYNPDELSNPPAEQRCCRTLVVQYPNGQPVPGSWIQYWFADGGHLTGNVGGDGSLCVNAVCNSQPQKVHLQVGSPQETIVTGAAITVDGTGQGNMCGGPQTCPRQILTLDCKPGVAGLECPAGLTCQADGHCEQQPCGNGVLDTGEACDDGNNQAGDGCSAACAIEPGFTCANPSTKSCAQGRTPDTVQIDPGTSLTAIGGSGGSAFDDPCGPGAVVRGFDFEVGPFQNQQWIVKSRARCAHLDINNGQVTLDDFPSPNAYGNGGSVATTTYTSTCAPGQVVVGFHGYSDTSGSGSGSYVAGVKLVCATVSATAQGRVEIGQPQELALIGRSPTDAGQQVCGPNQLVGGNVGRAGWIIDNFTMRCDNIVPACRQPSVCTPS